MHAWFMYRAVLSRAARVVLERGASGDVNIYWSGEIYGLKVGGISKSFGFYLGCIYPLFEFSFEPGLGLILALSITYMVPISVWSMSKYIDYLIVYP